MASEMYAIDGSAIQAGGGSDDGVQKPPLV